MFFRAAAFIKGEEGLDHVVDGTSILRVLGALPYGCLQAEIAQRRLSVDSIRRHEDLASPAPSYWLPGVNGVNLVGK